MPATLEAPPAADPGIAALEAQLPPDLVKGLNDHMATLDAPEQAETESPLPEAPVEPSEAVAPETLEATPPETAVVKAPNETVQPPASWQPDEVARQAIQFAGLPDEVVRDIRSNDELLVALKVAQRLKATASPSAAPSPPKPPSAFEEFTKDELEDPRMKKVLQELSDRDAELRQQVEQLTQGTQAQQQAIAQQRYLEVERAFDSQMDAMDVELFGKSDTLTPEQLQTRSAVWDKLVEFSSKGLVRELSPVAIEQAFFAARPQDFKEQLRRQTVSAARSQADQRLTAGRTTSPPRTPPAPEGPAQDAQVATWLEKAKRGELTKEG